MGQIQASHSQQKVDENKSMGKLSWNKQFLWQRSFFLLVLFLIPLGLQGQGVLTISPDRTVATAAGNGSFGYSGDSGSAVAASFAGPGAVAYDASGNLYIADTRNHVIRRVDVSGNISTVAGSGVQGFAGDGGPATSAALNSPSGIAVDGAGNLYIADTENQRIRRVSNGVITTIAGTGAFGFGGDGAAASGAVFASPTAVALDGSGSIYVADTQNHRIRKINSAGMISTFAGSGVQGYDGDNGNATSAKLDSPSSIAIDSGGRAYIADRHNHVVRLVNVNGIITTLAGNGAFGSSTNGAAATSVALASPSGVGVDSAGNVYIADSRNNRILQVGNGVITTVAGSGTEAYAGDNGAAQNASFNQPQAVAVNASGALAVADRWNQRIRQVSSNSLSFGTHAVGDNSATQTITLTNSGNAALQIQAAAISGSFGISGGSCSSLPIRLAPGSSCTEIVSFTPAIAGSSSGAIVFSGDGLVPQTLFLSGVATPTATQTTVVTSSASAYQNVAVVFTARVATATSGTPSGSVGFYDSETLLGTVALSGTGTATYSTSALSVGTHSITARYQGDGNYTGSVSAALSQIIMASPGFTIDPVSTGGDGGGSGSGGSGGGSGPTQTVTPGATVTYGFTIQAQSAPLTTPVVFSALGLPSGATATFNPPSIIPGLTASSFAMSIQTPKVTTTSAAVPPHLPSPVLPVVTALILLPLLGAKRLRTGAKGLSRSVLVFFVLLLSGVTVVSLSGCGSKATGYFGSAPQSYVITVVGTTTTSTGATVQRLANVTLVIQ